MTKIKYTSVDKILRKGYPTSAKVYKEAHAEADQAEKKKYPKGYAKMKTVDEKLKADELAGTHKRSGKVEVSKKVPGRLREEVAYHEFKESQAEKRLCAKCGKSKGSHK